ncbi:hypothetical protein WDW89_02610 [Deltaproteobacteria bacterium TL4]
MKTKVTLPQGSVANMNGDGSSISSTTFGTGETAPVIAIKIDTAGKVFQNIQFKGVKDQSSTKIEAKAGTTVNVDDQGTSVVESSISEGPSITTRVNLDGSSSIQIDDPAKAGAVVSEGNGEEVDVVKTCTVLPTKSFCSVSQTKKFPGMSTEAGIPHLIQVGTEEEIEVEGQKQDELVEVLIPIDPNESDSGSASRQTSREQDIRQIFAKTYFFKDGSARNILQIENASGILTKSIFDTQRGASLKRTKSGTTITSQFDNGGLKRELKGEVGKYGQTQLSSYYLDKPSALIGDGSSANISSYYRESTNTANQVTALKGSKIKIMTDGTALIAFPEFPSSASTIVRTKASLNASGAVQALVSVPPTGTSVSRVSLFPKFEQGVTFEELEQDKALRMTVSFEAAIPETQRDKSRQQENLMNVDIAEPESKNNEGFFLGTKDCVDEKGKSKTYPLYLVSPSSTTRIQIDTKMEQDFTSLTSTSGSAELRECGQIRAIAKDEEVSFSLKPLSVDLVKGHNLVALPGAVTLGAEDLSALFGQYQEVWAWKEDKWAFYTPDQSLLKQYTLEGVSLLESINPGEGFWVKSADDSKLYFEDRGGYPISARLKTLKSEWNLIGISETLSVDDVVKMINFSEKKKIQNHTFVALSGDAGKDDDAQQGIFSTHSAKISGMLNEGLLFVEILGVLFLVLLGGNLILSRWSPTAHYDVMFPKAGLAVMVALLFMYACGSGDGGNEDPIPDWYMLNKVHSIWTWNDNAWRAYSPHSAIQKELKSAGCKDLAALQGGSGFWIRISSDRSLYNIENPPRFNSDPRFHSNKKELCQ